MRMSDKYVWLCMPLIVFNLWMMYRHEPKSESLDKSTATSQPTTVAKEQENG